MASKKNTSFVIVISLTVLVIMVGYVAVQFLTDYLKYDRFSKQDFIDQNTYQAVFLTNNQTYFGRLKSISSDYLILLDVYYVKIDDNGAGQLVKLGSIEPHEPENKMIINRDQILFWENIKLDSLVVKKIQDMQ
ncbi:hypothetical protein A3H53_03025 [Candidatus Nomurabacteria bacterium RIFCSPLOWO2_02_FULL_40_10]|uniref:Uncharacterized protein n=2 Tax=Parcubacteria group TaxID=1794811 RepID=A0A1F6XZS7_9BACT|nr:MAG: hypothetical protein A3H53_03025 [Candidatus Nomurabacteria bacterium RIFCSPLOWO2_02_FULL_40_10]OGN10585.1 MAG: hypothetical protein A3J46_05225 [Candidatus Yanofskybacteria bacterium RIFCSPHIGHO2_02_FULL_41_11]